MLSVARTGILVLFLPLILLSLTSVPGEAANSATHGGLAEATLDNDFFVSGAILADIGHFLPGSPQSDTLAFAQGLIERARSGSNDLRFFAMGWYEHLEQDAEFLNSVAAILSAHPEYTITDVRLAFDYLSIMKHQTDVNITFIMENAEIVEAISAGFSGIPAQEVRQAIWDFVYSYSAEKPGLIYQRDAAMIYARLYPDRIASMEAEYETYFEKVTRSYYNPFLGDFTMYVDCQKIQRMRGSYRDIRFTLKDIHSSRIPDDIPVRA